MNYLYLLVDGELCKIGCSNNPHRRTRDVGYFSYDPERGRDAPIVAAWPVGAQARSVEFYLTKRLFHRRAPGLASPEWFAISRREMVVEIRRALRAFGISCRAIHRRRDRKGRLTSWPGDCTLKRFCPDG